MNMINLEADALLSLVPLFHETGKDIIVNKSLNVATTALVAFTLAHNLLPWVTFNQTSNNYIHLRIITSWKQLSSPHWFKDWAKNFIPKILYKIMHCQERPYGHSQQTWIPSVNGTQTKIPLGTLEIQVSINLCWYGFQQ